MPTPGYAGPDSFTYRAFNDAGFGNIATVSLTVIAPTTIQPPTGLHVSSIVGNLVTLQWSHAGAPGSLPTGHVLEGGLKPGEVLASIATGSPYPIFTFTAPTGSFYLRMHAIDGAERSGPSMKCACS